MNDNSYRQVAEQLGSRLKKGEEKKKQTTDKELAVQTFKTFNFIYKI
ncbi:hypothetical protein [Clostridium sp.]